MGVLVYEADRLLFRQRSHLGRYRVRYWNRSDLQVGIGSWIDAQDVSSRLPSVQIISVRCRYVDQTFELAVSQGRYTALRSWVEAVPPGWNADVA
jgi:hypothetical protein